MVNDKNKQDQANNGGNKITEAKLQLELQKALDKKKNYGATAGGNIISIHDAG